MVVRHKTNIQKNQLLFHLPATNLAKVIEGICIGPSSREMICFKEQMFSTEENIKVNHVDLLQNDQPPS